MPTPKKNRLVLVVVALVAGLAAALPHGSASAAAPSMSQVVRATHVYSQFSTGGGFDQSFSSPAIGDVTGDGNPDVLTGGMDGTLTAIYGPATPQLITIAPGHPIQASPALVDLTGDGILDVVVATLGRPAYVAAYSWVPNFRQVFVATANRTDTNLNGFVSTPAVDDVNGDGVLDIIVGGLDHRLHAFNSATRQYLPGFPADHYDTIISSPTLADIDGDGLKEIVIGGDMDHGGTMSPAGGWIWARNGDGSVVPGYPMHLSSQTIWSSPAIGDVDGDGDGDIVVGTGRGTGSTAGSGLLFAFDARTRNALPGWPINLSGNTMASPVLSNLDGDPQLEITMALGNGFLYTFQHNGSVMWGPADYMNFSRAGATDYALISSPVMANLDGDPTPEVAVSGEREVKIFDATTGALEARLPLQSTQQSAAHPGAATPAVGRDAQGRAILAVHVLHEITGSPTCGGNLCRGNGDEMAVYLFRSSAAVAGGDAWGHFLRTNRRDASLLTAPAPVDQGRFVDAVYRVLLGREPDAGGRAYWSDQLRRGLSRIGFTNLIARFPEWTNVVVDDLYQDVFGRPADSSGLSYWSEMIRQGERVANIAAALYGSAEYFASAGNDPGAFVDALYADILRRSTADDPQGRSYWVGRLQAGTSRALVAQSMFRSYEACSHRVADLYQQILARAADPAGLDYWSRQLGVLDDIALAAHLAASDEFYSRAMR